MKDRVSLSGNVVFHLLEVGEEIVSVFVGSLQLLRDPFGVKLVVVVKI